MGKPFFVSSRKAILSNFWDEVLNTVKETKIFLE